LAEWSQPKEQHAVKYNSLHVLATVGLAISCLHGATGGLALADAPTHFTLLEEVRPNIAASSIAYPGGNYEVSNMVDGDVRTEYSSASKGTETHIDFDFGQTVSIAGFHHVERADPATVAKALLTFSDSPAFKGVLGTVELQHANSRGGTTCTAFPPVKARYVRWQVVALGPKGYGTVGGAEISFFTAAAQEPAPTKVEVCCSGVAAVLRDQDRLAQPLDVTVVYPYAEPADGTVQIADSQPVSIRLNLGTHAVPLPPVPAVEKETPVEVTVKVAGHAIRRTTVLQPVRHWELWFLPHSHNDIGYTHVQAEVERKQWQYLADAVELARRTADYPEGSRFKWNVEVMWAVDSYIQQATPEKRAEFVEAIRRGWIGLDALYGNELTALCRPEELFRLTDCARRITNRYKLEIDSAMISDVPGYTWGIVPALAHSRVKYFSIGPNHIHRIGRTLTEWGDRPFYWTSPSGQERVLCWVAGHAYSWFHPGLLGSIQNVKPQSFLDYLGELEGSDYPYDMVQIRYSIGGDNGPPDPNLPEFARQWNAKYAWPRMMIATTGELMREFEARYGDELPEVRGDFTPYWEDGAASSARETSLVRNASERLVQAEALWAMLDPAGYSDADFYAAWRNALLYNEHTWGAHCSISQPDSRFTMDQWKTKQAFAVEADQQSRKLHAAATEGKRSGAQEVTAVDVYNTCSWPRTDLVVLPAAMAVVGHVVKTPDGVTVPSQKLASGQLAFLATEVPPLGAMRFLLKPGAASIGGSAKAEGSTLESRHVRVRADEKTGAITDFHWTGTDVNLAGNQDIGLNKYFYVAGRDPKTAESAGPVKITVVECGPLVASLVAESDAPGCRKLRRQIRVIDGLPRVDLTNLVDRERVRSPDSVHFGFAPNVPEGVMRMDIPWAIIRPEQDQLPGACKNYFTVGRWVDVSNDDFGVTWATVDAPLVEVGAITVDVSSPFRTEAWIRQLEPTQTFYSYVMNNYWETNYKASQEGPTEFRYSLRPHGPFDAAATVRFGVERSNPFVVVPVDPQTPLRKSMLRVEPDEVIVTSLKPSTDGKSLMLRLFNAGDQPAACRVVWIDPIPVRVAHSSPFEEWGEPVREPIELPPQGIVTLRALYPRHSVQSRKPRTFR
jgi:hypothetical protein